MKRDQNTKQSGQATTELLLVSVWFFIVVLLVIQFTVTMAGSEAASYVAYMSVRADTAGASAEVMTEKLKRAIPGADSVNVRPAVSPEEDTVRKTVNASSLFLLESLDSQFNVMDEAGSSPFRIEASAEMPRPASARHNGDNDLF